MQLQTELLVRPKIIGSNVSKGQRDRIYIVKDIIHILSEYGELNQTTLLSYSGLNLTKHRNILEELESREMIRKENHVGKKRNTSVFKATQKGINFYKSILDPYETIFPRKSLQETRTIFQ